MINRVFITGDTHANFSRFRNYDKEIQKDENTAIIILGDAGFNYFLDDRDSHLKNKISKTYKFKIYCVRGNHEARPQNVDGMEMIYDHDVQGEVYYQSRWPNIRYFRDFGIYYILNYKIGIIGGAYSVDKFYRLSRGIQWFQDEQLSSYEMDTALQYFTDQKVHFMLTHTCPIQWEPTDLFLGFIDQSKVDKKMEIFLENIKHNVMGNIWCFGHYHANRIERPHVEQFFTDTENINDIWNRWKYYDETGELDWWLAKSPNFYMGVNNI